SPDTAEQAFRLRSVYETSANHTNLPSFPTRRSSDLKKLRYLLESPGRHPNAPSPAALKKLQTALGELHDRDILSFQVKALSAPRSEEHTSELQSQSNLVCRLLLEKKKNTDNLRKGPH